MVRRSVEEAEIRGIDFLASLPVFFVEDLEEKIDELSKLIDEKHNEE